MKKKRADNNRKKVKKYAICPSCNRKVAIEVKLGQTVIVKCPNCGNRGQISIPKIKKSYLKKSKIILKIPKKITIKNTLWIIFLFCVSVILVFLFFLSATGYINMKILFVSIFIGIAILKELTDEYVPVRQKKNVNIIVSGFIIIFILIVINEIISFISK